MWNGEKIDNGTSPDVIAYFHPECAKKHHFANNSVRPISPSTKEKTLRNLNQISFDQAGHFANAELLKNPNYYGTAKKRELGIYQIKIAGEEINLLELDREENENCYLEIRNAVVSNIRQNISEWEIKKDEYNNDFLENKKTGVKVWTIIFKEIVFENEKKDWAEIKALLEEKSLSVNKISEVKKNQILQYFLQNGITKIILENGKLVFKYSDKNKKVVETEDQEQQKYHQLIQNLPNQRLSLSELQNDNTNSSSVPGKNNTGIFIALIISAIILGGALVYFLVQKKKK